MRVRITNKDYNMVVYKRDLISRTLVNKILIIKSETNIINFYTIPENQTLNRKNKYNIDQIIRADIMQWQNNLKVWLYQVYQTERMINPHEGSRSSSANEKKN